MMSTPVPYPQPRGIDYSLPTCGQTLCNGQGTCVLSPAGGGDTVCECKLGYAGEFCHDTVNGELSLPLTLSVLAAIIGLLIVAYVFAKLRQRQKRQKSRRKPEEQGYNIVV